MTKDELIKDVTEKEITSVALLELNKKYYYLNT